MDYLVYLVIGLGIVAALLVALKALLSQQGRGGAGALPYRRKDYLLSRGERAYYEALRAAMDGGDVVIFVKVRLLDLLWLPKGTEGAAGHRNRVMSKHVDFVLCDRRELRPLLVIELDDHSHERPDRRARDELVDRVLAAAGLPILHTPARASYTPQGVAQEVLPLLQAQTLAATLRR